MIYKNLKLQALGTIWFRFLQKKSKKNFHACVPLKGFGILVQNARTTLPFILGHYCVLWQEVGVCTFPPTPVKLGPAEIQVKQPGGMKGHRAGHIYIHLHTAPFQPQQYKSFWIRIRIRQTGIRRM
jgi:hypothetical protein